MHDRGKPMTTLRGHFINTRPLDRAAELSEVLVGAGWQVTALPLLALLPLRLASEDMQQLSALRSATATTVIVVVSPTAARLGLAAVQQVGLDPKLLSVHWLAVGEGTAQVLAAAGLHAELPAVASSEGLMATPLLRAVQPQDTVMVWRGLGGRELVQQDLLARGVRLQVLNLYQRQLPEESRLSWAVSQKAAFDVKKNDSSGPTVVLLSSGESWRHWQTIAQSEALKPWLLVLGSRLMAEVQGLTPRVKELHSLQPKHILRVLTEIEDL
jgi:uroporphyrinogen-III synthase